MDIEVVRSIHALPAEAWNRLTDGNPFQRHEFFAALEDTGCVGSESGWYPSYIVVREQGELAAVASSFVKTHSMGEYVYDFSWARSAQHYGIAYYPKLVVASPFSPVSGQRLHARNEDARQRLAAAIPVVAKEIGCAGAHILFLKEDECANAEASGAMIRHAFQYQWHNRGYGTFDDYLESLRSRRRKEVRRERRSVQAAGIHVRALTGREIPHSYIREIYKLYLSTCNQYQGGGVYLNEAFFERVITTMPEQVVFFGAYRGETLVAGAFCLRDHSKLFGRYWGSREDVPNLHFETSLYAPIEWAIKEGIQTIEPGAGGEHKFPRGFLPTKTFSAHWHNHPSFHDALADFCQRETAAIDQHIHQLLTEETPFQRDPRD